MLSLVTAAVFALTPAAAGQPSDTALLIAFADTFDRAQLTKDAAALDRMTSDDLIFIDGSGKRQGKAAFIAGWTAPGDRFEPIILVDRTVTVVGDNVGIVGAEVNLKGRSAGKPFSSRFRFADTFEKTKVGWRAVHIQVTRIP
jgi:ketosteroid isomerase-like protein